MSRIFISHSHADNAAAIAVRDWMRARGWDDVFLDLDPERGLKAGERWQEALKRAAHRCELVIFLISPAWAQSKWCLAEFLLAKSLNKRVFAAVVSPTTFEAMPIEMTSEWQVVDLTAGNRDTRFTVTLPPGDRTADVVLAGDGLNRLAIGLQQAGLDAKYFEWPPKHEPGRSPCRGLRPLEADDAGVFFGREAPIIEAIDRLRGLAQAAPPRLMVILGASGAGKSSFMRAGLLPRLGRDPLTFLPLPVIRPERAAIGGESGLVAALAGAFEAATLKIARSDIREAVASGAGTLKPLLVRLLAAAQPAPVDGSPAPKPPTLVLSVDQGEELFLAEAQGEAQPFLALLRDLLVADAPSVVAVFTIRSDNYERLQSAPGLDGIRQETLSLPPMPKGSYAEVVKGPIRRLEGTPRALKIDDALVEALLSDIEAGGAKDALPLLAFTLERLYGEFGTPGHLTLEHYDKLRRIKGSIEAAVERAFEQADKDARIPRDRDARLTLLRRGLIPWLAGIDPDTKAPRRRVARLSEVPAEARPLIELLVQERLLSTDVAKDTGETTIEPAHEALLRQWGLLQGWLEEDTGLLTVLDGIKRAARDWAANDRRAPWRTHAGERLAAARRLTSRMDLVAHLTPTDVEYIAACNHAQQRRRSQDRRRKTVVGTLAASVVVLLGLAATGVLEPNAMKVQARRLADLHMPAFGVMPNVLTTEREQSLKAGDRFRECWSCPEMVVVPTGKFTMGSNDGLEDQKPVHTVTISARIAVGRFEVTFDEWDGCVAHGGCPIEGVAGANYGRGRQPAINVSWDEANRYVKWMSERTSKTYRLLTEAEWEFAARAGTATRYSFDEYGSDEYGSEEALAEHAWFNESSASRAHPVGNKKPNAFGLHDMHGNVWEWVQDCYFANYNGAPNDGAAATDTGSCSRVVRGGAWLNSPAYLGSAFRFQFEPEQRGSSLGFRVARVLSPARTPLPP